MIHADKKNRRPDLWPKRIEIRFSSDHISVPSIRQWLEPRKEAMTMCKVSALVQAGPENANKFEGLAKFLSDTRRVSIKSLSR